MASEKEVATHVLVPEDYAERLRKLSAQTRINQSEFLREAVDDLLLGKYGLQLPGADSSMKEPGHG